MTNGQSQTNLGVQPNVGGLLCYAPCCVGLIFSIVAAIVEKQSRFIRFHAFQSLLLHAGIFVVAIALQVATLVMGMVAGPLAAIVSLISIPVGLGFLGLAIFLMVKAYQNEEWAIPTLGDMAKKWV